MYLTKKESIISNDNKILFFSINDFIDNIYLNDNCFICGANNKQKQFNDEHVFPKWVLKKFKLFNSNITLSNGNKYRYDKYKIPCCIDCNKLLGDIFETQISNAFSKEYGNTINFLENNLLLIFQWLSLLFIKIRIRDKKFKIIINDSQKQNDTIGDFYERENLHHIRCICRTIYTQIPIDSNVIGSLLIVPAKQSEDIENFDFIDIHEGKTILIRINDIAIIGVLNDSGAALKAWTKLINKINGPLNPLQLRELAVKFAINNANMKSRPRYYSNINNNKISIKADIPNIIEISDRNEKKYGEMLLYFLKDFLKQVNPPDINEHFKQIKSGKFTYILDEKGNFNLNGWKLNTNKD